MLPSNTRRHTLCVVKISPPMHQGDSSWLLEGHLAYVPDPLPPQFALELSTVNLLADAERALGELKGVGQRLPNPHLLINPFLRREAVLSSRIEGTTAGLQQLLLFETAPSDEPGDSDVREVANYVAALELGFSLLEKLPVSLRLIREVHEQLMEDVRGQEQRPGEFRHFPTSLAIAAPPRHRSLCAAASQGDACGSA